MTQNLRYIGHGYTNSNGVATLDYDANGDPITGSGYTGTGAGEIDLLAKLHDDNSVVTPVVRLFDCPVFDGNNTPASLDLSGTNNAVLTDEVVTLSCAVKNSSNNPCINIPVVFKQGNTVLGTAYTDCSGVATITYTWVDSDIFNVTAQVGQSLSEDLTMFVKDKNNILDYRFDENCFSLYNAVVSEVENGYHYTANSNSASGLTAKLNNQTFFIPTTTGFTVEFDCISQNQIGMYITKQGNNYYFGVSVYSGLKHLKFKYNGETIEYSINNEVSKTAEVDFEDNPAGFNITDWQDDMDITITNFKIDKNQ